MKPKKVVALESLIDQCRRLSRELRAAADEVHADLELTAGTRVLLRHLSEQGPATVPQIARARNVSRQHVQMVVNRFQALGLVALEENPKHRRSRIVRLTDAGAARVAGMDAREERIWRLLSLNVKRKDLDAAAVVLNRLRRLLDSEEWRQAVSEGRGELRP